MAIALEMQANLLETIALVVDAETGERGYILTGKDEYLEPYTAALPRIDNALHRLREMLIDNGTVAERDILGHINTLVGKRLSELEAAIALSELSNHLQVVREEEKAKLARDIHDELGGILVSAKMDVAWVEKRLRERDPDAAAKLDRTLQTLDAGVETKRRIIEELRPTLLDNLGLPAALDWQVHEICDRAGIQCAISLPAEDAVIEPSVAIALYRIVQEALTNIVKYARAKNVTVDLAVTGDDITLLIEDDGVAIPQDAQVNRLSHGIAGMRQRARALHGDFRIGRRPEGGTLIEVNVPVARSAQPPTDAPQAVSSA